MNEEQLRDELEAMTEWPGDAPRLWEKALKQCDAGPVGTITPGASHASTRWVFGAVAAAALLVVTAAAVMPNLGKARSSARVASRDAVSVPMDIAMDAPAEPFEFGAYPELVPQERSVFGLVPETAADGLARDGADRRTRGAGVPDAFGVPQPVDSPRAVVRKATLEIISTDVRADAIRVQQLLSAARGEYVESADINERDAARPRADLILRVEAGRLDALLSDLRELGQVESERVDAEDVTEQLVDLGARLENERRVEAELLGLLESRADDTLEDLLVARRELHAVRERIERLAAQREYLGRLVRLARVAVMLRSEAVEEEPAAPRGVWAGFVEDLGEAWRDGVGGLLGSVTWLVRVVVGGAVWFLVCWVACVFAYRIWRREHPRRLAE